MAPSRILVVEDEIITAMSLVQSLKDLGYEVVGSVRRGEEAVQKAEDIKPDLIVMDITLDGDIDGIEAASRIRSFHDAAIVYLTAHTAQTVFERAKDTEPHAYLTKPISSHELGRTVEMALYKHEADKRVRESERNLKNRDRLASILLTGGSDEEVFDDVLQVILEVMESKYGVFGYINEEEALVCPSMTRDIWDECQIPGKQIVFPHETWGGIWGKSLLEKRTIASNGPFIAPEGHIPLTCVLDVPIIRDGVVVGNLLVANKKTGYIEKDSRLLESMAEFLAPVLYARLQREREERKRRQAQEALHASEATLKGVLRAAPVGIGLVVDRNFVWTSESLSRMVGYSSEELIGQSARILYESDEEYERVGKEKYAEIVEHGLGTIETRFKRRDGSVIDIWLSSAPIVPGDLSAGVVFTAQDITEKKRTEANIREEIRFRDNILAALTHSFYVINADDYTISLANNAAVSSGVSIGSTCYSTHGVVAPCKGTHHLCPMEELKRTRQPIMVEHVHFDQEGQKRNIEVYAYPILDAEGIVKQVIEYCLDVTDRTWAQKALLQREATLNTILSLSPSGISYFREGKLVWANPVMMELFGYSKEDKDRVLGKGYKEFYESESEFGRVRELFRAQLAEGKPAEGEARLRRKDGSIFIGNISVSSPNLADSTAGTTVVISDITSRKLAEEERLLLITAIEQSVETIVITDKEGTIQYVNPSFERITGYTRKDAIGQNPRILNSGQHDELFYKEMWETLIRGDVWRGHIVNKKKDGNLFQEEATISPVKDESGDIVNYVAVKRDVTDQLLLEKQLQQAQKMESIGTLAGGIAHDFNNLLQIVLGYADILTADKERELHDVRNLEIIRKAAKDGRDLVKGLLTFSRQVESELRPIDLNQQLRRIHRILRRTIPRMIEIDLSLSDDLNAVNADPVQMEQVLLNLAVNAHHAMPKEGKLTIETLNVTLDDDYCSTHAEVEPGDYVLLKISDTGHGMEKEVVDRIFEPFYTTKEAGEGTGLGLSIVYGIVKNHGGHVTCSSKPGQGTTFTIFLPAFIPGIYGLDTEIDVGEMPPIGTETILIVDDEEPIRDMLKQTLTRSGYRVFTAEDGERALLVYMEKMEEIDLIILDLIMPGMGGEQCLHEILKIDPDANIVIASGYLVNKAMTAVLERGARGFIEKPCDAGPLLREVRKILDETGSLVNRVRGNRTVPIQSVEDKETSFPASGLLSSASQLQETSGIEEFPWRLRILAIDDRVPYLRMLEEGLAQFGQKPLTASSATKGLQMFQETPVDLVICDLEMPEMDGWEVGRRIREICRQKDIHKTPLILLTGQTDMEDMLQKNTKEMAECGVDAILGKPMDIPEILKFAERLIRKSDTNIRTE